MKMQQKYVGGVEKIVAIGTISIVVLMMEVMFSDKSLLPALSASRNGSLSAGTISSYVTA